MRTRSITTILVVVMLQMTLVACGDDGDEPEGAVDDLREAAVDDLDEMAPLAAEAAPPLDVEAGRADTPGGPVDATQAAEDTFVAAVDEDLHIGVQLGDEVDDGREALVYLCDGEVTEYLTGDLDPEATVLEGNTMDVELALADGEVTGAVTRHGEEPTQFVAQEASGAAGIYAAGFVAEDVDYRPVWVVLEDGSQQGGACWRCCAGQECHICCPTTAQTAGVTVDWTELQYWWRRLTRN